MGIEAILGISAFVVFFALWVILPNKIHKGNHLDEEES